MAADTDHAYRNRGGLETRAGTEQKRGDEHEPGAERIRSDNASRRGTDTRRSTELERTRSIVEEDDRPHYSPSSDKARGKDRAQAKDLGYQRDDRTRAERAEPRILERSSRHRASVTEKQPDDEPSLEYDTNSIGAGYEGRSASKSKGKARKPEPVVPKRESRRLMSERDYRENLDRDTRTEHARRSTRKEPSEHPVRHRKAEKEADETRGPGDFREREANAVVKERKFATEPNARPTSAKKGHAKQVAQEKGPDKTPAIVAGTLEGEEKYSTDSEDYYEEITEEVLEPDPHDLRQGRGGVIIRRTTRSTSKTRKYGKPNARKSGAQPSSRHKTTTASEKKQHDDEIDAEKKNETPTSDAEDSYLPALDSEEKETGTCPCCGSCWPSHMDESRMKAVQGKSRIWRRRLRRGDEGPVGDEWYEVRNFGPKQNSRFKQKTDKANTDGGGIPPYSAQQLYRPAVQGQDVYYNAYQPNLQSPYQRPQHPLFPASMSFPQPYPMPPAMVGAYCGAAQANSAFPAATSGYCPTCRAQAHLGPLSFGCAQPVPTISMEDFLRREQRVRQEERLRLEEKQLREEKLRREERLRQEERLRREQRARKEERRRRELEEERLRQQERLRLEERFREERLEQQRRERLERQRRERLEEQRRYNDTLRRALAEQRMAADRGAAVPPSGFLDEVLMRGRLRPAPCSVSSRTGLQDGLRTRDLLLRDSERPAASTRGASRPLSWDDVKRYTETTGDPRDGWGPPSRGGGRFR
ncbi:trichohyalin-like [Dermacentor albipictus]|uniref:trichohyalin-like n=1 Tax=Dermacentor albipictus TaxID=60249 RepID=UPI0031FD072C